MLTDDTRYDKRYRKYTSHEKLLGEASAPDCVVCGKEHRMVYKDLERPLCIWCFLKQCEEMEIL